MSRDVLREILSWAKWGPYLERGLGLSPVKPYVKMALLMSLLLICRMGAQWYGKTSPSRETSFQAFNRKETNQRSEARTRQIHLSRPIVTRAFDSLELLWVRAHDHQDKHSKGLQPNGQKSHFILRSKQNVVWEIDEVSLKNYKLSSILVYKQSFFWQLEKGGRQILVCKMVIFLWFTLLRSI